MASPVLDRDVTTATVVNTVTRPRVFLHASSEHARTNKMLRLTLLASVLNNSGGTRTPTIRYKWAATPSIPARHRPNDDRRYVYGEFLIAANNATNAPVLFHAKHDGAAISEGGGAVASTEQSWPVVSAQDTTPPRHRRHDPVGAPTRTRSSRSIRCSGPARLGLHELHHPESRRHRVSRMKRSWCARQRPHLRPVLLRPRRLVLRAAIDAVQQNDPS